MDISSSSIKYQPGDSFGIICPNTDQDVTTLIERLEVADQADTVFTLDLIADTKKRNAVIPSFIHEKSTLRHSLTTCFDIRAVPKKAFIRVLAEYTKDHGEKRRLQELCSKQGAKDYTEFIREQNISVLDILLAFPSCLPPIERFLEQLTRLQPRPYSISSSPLHSSSLHFVFNIVEIPAGSGRSYARKGLCTGWLNSITKTLQKSVDSDLANGVSELTLETSDVKIPIFTRSNQNFHLPEDISRPIIMIGPGTGVAPFVGFLQHREQQRKTGSTIGKSWLFFGCRNKEKDFLYEKQLVDLTNSGVLTKFHVSFSRDHKERDEPRYVQDNIKLNGESVAEWITENDAVVYVCGDAKCMAKNVNEALADVLVECKGMSKAEATAYLMKMRLHRRYLEDVWT
ncbi:unnamed protein product [Owenia fusiformis]|uniref:Methionine synthase reductase n=1 Tax=Owenia fusiformis TaxID=6347 RepID=A0A8S4MVM6_OWEFU|nr:unnamed protein product [Owenia fusiformis]